MSRSCSTTCSPRRDWSTGSRDERGLYSDSAAVGLLRLALIELGRRMFEAGRINFMYDTLDLTSADIDALLDGSPTPTADELSARVATRKRAERRGCSRAARPAASASAARRSASTTARG